MKKKTTLSLIIIFLLFSLFSFKISALDLADLDKINYQILESYNHDPKAFTQGLELHQDYLYESTGLYARSSLRKIDKKSKELIKKIALEDKYFGEGLTVLNNKIYQLSWKENTAFVYDLNLNLIKKFNYTGEGWGLANNAQYLIMSDGSEYIYFRDPETFKLIDKIEVKINQQKVKNINELEYLNGFIYANIWQENYIIKIDINTGQVKSYLDLNRVLALLSKKNIDVLNGIAYDSDDKSFLVTGKLWPKIFKIKFRENELQ